MRRRLQFLAICLLFFACNFAFGISTPKVAFSPIDSIRNSNILAKDSSVKIFIVEGTVVSNLNNLKKNHEVVVVKKSKSEENSTKKKVQSEKSKSNKKSEAKKVEELSKKINSSAPKRITLKLNSIPGSTSITLGSHRNNLGIVAQVQVPILSKSSEIIFDNFFNYVQKNEIITFYHSFIPVWISESNGIRPPPIFLS